MHFFIVFIFFLVTPCLVVGQVYEFRHVGVTITKGQFRPGLRNLEAKLGFMNDEHAVYNVLVQPFEYHNDFTAIGVGSGYFITSKNFGLYSELYWNHHRDLFYSEVDGLVPDGIPMNNTVIEVKRRLNYTTIGMGTVFFRHVLLGIGLDFGKLSLKYRQFGVQDTAKPIFTNFLGGSDLISPGGRLTAVNVFSGLIVVASPVLVHARIYYQKQIFPTSFMKGDRLYHFDASNWGFKFIVAFGKKIKK